MIPIIYDLAEAACILGFLSPTSDQSFAITPSPA